MCESLNSFWYKDRSFFKSSHLKIIACLAMFLSHLAQGSLIYNLGYTKTADLFMLIGRISMPLFSFMVCQGMSLSRDKKSYIKRLFIFALISEIPYDLSFRGNFLDFYSQNVIFTLFLGSLLIYTWQYLDEKNINSYIKIFIEFLIFWIIAYISIITRTDYDFKGIIAISLLYLARKNRYLTALAIFVSFYFSAYVSGHELYIPFMVYLSIPFVLLYNGQKGSYPKWGFYIFYPGHLLLIYLLNTILF